MTKRLTKATEYLRHNYTVDERLKMADELAGAHNRMEDIESEEAVVKAQFKDRKAQVEQTVQKLARQLSSGFEMVNVECKLIYGDPNPLEVSYYRIDTGEKVKTRAMHSDEMQEELPLTDREGDVEVIPPAVAETVAAESAQNIEEFFKPGRPTEFPTAESAAPIPESSDASALFAEPVIPTPAEENGVALDSPEYEAQVRTAMGAPEPAPELLLNGEPATKPKRSKSGPKQLQQEHERQLDAERANPEITDNDVPW